MKKLLLTLMACLGIATAQAAEPANLYLLGNSINDASEWGTKYAFTNTSGTTWTISIDKLGESFKINDGSWDKGFNIGSKDNAQLTGGTPYTAWNNSDSGNIMFSDCEYITNAQITITNPSSENPTITVTGTKVGTKATKPAALYLVGSNVNGNENWNASETNKFTEVQEGIYTIELASLGTKFKIYDGSWSTEWNYGSGEGSVSLNIPYKTTKSGGGDIPTTGTFNNVKVTFVLENSTLTVTQNGADKTYPTSLYVIGTVEGITDENWNPTIGIKLETQDGGKTFDGQVVLSQSPSYFGFCENLGQNNNDWNLGMRFQPGKDGSGNDKNVSITSGVEEVLLFGSDGAWTIEGGKYDFHVDYDNMTFTVTEIMELPTGLNIIGEFNENGEQKSDWTTGKSMTAGSTGNTFTISDVKLMGADGSTNAYFRFITDASLQYGAENEVEASLQNPNPLVQTDQNAYYLPNGTYTFTVNVEDWTFTVTGTPDPIIPDLYLRGSSVDGKDAWNNPVKLNYENGEYTWSGETLGYNFKITGENYDTYNFGSNGEKIKLNDPYIPVNKETANIEFGDATQQLVNPKITVTLDGENASIILTGDKFELAPVETMVVQGVLDGEWNGGSGETLLTLAKVENNPGVYTGVLENITSASEFKIVVNGVWFGWGEMPLYSNANVTQTFNSAVEGNCVIINADDATDSDVTITVDWYNGTVLFEGNGYPELNPETLWIVGPFNEWQLDEEEPDNVLEQTAPNSGIYTGSFDWEATCEYEGKVTNYAEFKIAYGTDWAETLGNTTADPFFIYASTNPYKGSYNVGNAGENWTIYNWAGGKINITVDMNQQTITIDCPEQPAYAAPAQVYLMGSFDNWKDGVQMENLGNGEFSLKYEFPAPEAGKTAEFKLMTSNDEWYGAVEGQSNIALTLNQPVEYEMTQLGNDNNWVLNNWTGGELVFTANFSATGNTLTLNQTSGVNSINNALDGSEVIFNLQGVRVNRENLGRGIYIINGKKVLVK